jgi:hypothetical protein
VKLITCLYFTERSLHAPIRFQDVVLKHEKKINFTSIYNPKEIQNSTLNEASILRVLETKHVWHCNCNKIHNKTPRLGLHYGLHGPERPLHFLMEHTLGPASWLILHFAVIHYNIITSITSPNVAAEWSVPLFLILEFLG